MRAYLISGYILLCIFLGGASLAGFLANLALQLAALPILVWALMTSPIGTRPPARLLQWLLLGMFGLMLIQVIPLPPALWSLLPGRDRIVDGFELMGQDLPWLSWSLSPRDTLGAMLWLLPAAAVVMGMIRLGAYRPSLLAWTIAGATLVSVMIGAIQLTGETAQSFYFYRVTNYGAAVGPFANANHMATLLLISIPFLFALIGHAKSRQRSSRRQQGVSIVSFAFLAVVAVGLVLNTSLAGIGLAVPVTLLSLLLLRKPSARLPYLAIGVVGSLSIAAMALVFILPIGNNLVGSDAVSATSRATSVSITMEAARDHLPLGTGFGSFAAIYRTYEDPATVDRTWMNHAHSDYAEILLEGGIPAALLVILLLAWWVRRVRALWSKGTDNLFARAATIASGAVLLHSLVDYPLRTAAISALFAACLALMTEARSHHASRKRSSDEEAGRHLTA